MKYFEIRIGKTIRLTPKSSPQYVDAIVETAFTIEEVENYLIGRYGYLPKGRNKIYRDTQAGDVEIVGFLHSFWEKDYINGPSYRQTDWIEIAEITKKVVLIHAKGKKQYPKEVK